MSALETASQRFRRAIVSLIERSPGSVVLLRAYNVTLRLLGSSYRALTYFGATMLCDPTDLVQHCVLHFGVWEPNVSAAIERVLKTGDLCVDVGANVGYDTLLAAYCVGSRGKVVAIEASPSIFALLQANVVANGLSNVRLINRAASDRAGMLAFYAGPPGNRGRSTTLPARQLPLEAQVEALPLDEMLTPEERAAVRLIKIDIEGAEAPVVRRLLDTLALYNERMVLLVEISPSDEWRELFTALLEVGFLAYAIENDYSRRYYLHERHIRISPRRVTQLPAGQMDVLFARTDAALRDEVV